MAVALASRFWRLGCPKIYHEVATRLRALHRGAPEAPAEARFGAIAFIHRFGASLNVHLHYHCCLTEGLFCVEEGGVRFYPSTVSPEAIAEVQQRTRRRVLRLFKRRGILPADVVEDMLAVVACRRFLG